MPQMSIRGIQIEFPHEPYDVQVEYMTRVIECLQEKRNGILESPTGTGKTLCLLVATLGWLLAQKQSEENQEIVENAPDSNAVYEDIDQHYESDEDDLFSTRYVPRNTATEERENRKNSTTSDIQIIFTARTHSQLHQVIEELKQTVYATRIKSCVLGSRVQLCIHAVACSSKKNDTISNCCKRLVANFEALKDCNGGRLVEESTYCDKKLKAECYVPNIEGNNILDIEDLIQIGSNNNCCPFYLSKKMKNNADIIFAPYNYIFDPSIRQNLPNVKGKIVIVDEAHNIARICEEMSSLQLRETTFTRSIEEITLAQSSILMEPSFSPAKPFTAKLSSEELLMLKDCFQTLESNMQCMEETKLTSTKNRSYLLDFFCMGNLEKENYWKYLNILESLIQYLNISPIVYERNKSNLTAPNLKKVQTVIKTVFEDLEYTEEEICFKVHITKNVLPRSSNLSQGEGLLDYMETVLNYYCLNPAINMQRLRQEEPHCLLLTSGTLSPINHFISELGLGDSPYIVVQNHHIIDESQLFVGVLSNGPDKFPLESTFVMREHPNYITTLGRTIQTFSKSVPGGILIFFPSYKSMYTCSGRWKENGLPIFDVNKPNEKRVFIESKEKDQFENTILQYYETVANENCSGAIFMGVCKGKVSEGIDFADSRGRAVFVTGIPYPPMHDPLIQLKRQYLKEIHRLNPKEMSDTDWYTLEAMRPVSQAIGRIIRHKNDFGAILLCDRRYEDKRLQTFLPLWLRKKIFSSTYGKVRQKLILFMRSHATKAVVHNIPAHMGTPNIEDVIEPAKLENIQCPSLKCKRSREDCDETEQATGKILSAKKNLLPLFNNNSSLMQCKNVASTSGHGSFTLLMDQVSDYLDTENQEMLLRAFQRYETTGKQDFIALFPTLACVLFQSGSLNHLMPVVCLHLKHAHAKKLRSICETLDLQLSDVPED